MPGSYPDPHACVNTAINALESAYEESYDTPAGSLILTALEAIKRLKQDMKRYRHGGESEYDPYELNEFNSAV